MSSRYNSVLPTCYAVTFEATDFTGRFKKTEYVMADSEKEAKSKIKKEKEQEALKKQEQGYLCRKSFLRHPVLDRL